jgi:ribonuclease HII
VILEEPIEGLKDSKKLGPARREELSLLINLQAKAVGLGWVDAATIDRVGITMAVKWAMERALEQIAAEYDEVIIDGQTNFLDGNAKARAVIKADASMPVVSAASIVAKVARDKYMVDMANLYPNYGFERHVGYGTALHLERLKKHGVTKLHRQSFKPIQQLLKLGAQA